MYITVYEVLPATPFALNLFMAIPREYCIFPGKKPCLGGLRRDYLLGGSQ